MYSLILITIAPSVRTSGFLELEGMSLNWMTPPTPYVSFKNQNWTEEQQHSSSPHTIHDFLQHLFFLALTCSFSASPPAFDVLQHQTSFQKCFQGSERRYHQNIGIRCTTTIGTFSFFFPMPFLEHVLGIFCAFSFHTLLCMDCVCV
jgi:hypothetical protein